MATEREKSQITLQEREGDRPDRINGGRLPAPSVAGALGLNWVPVSQSPGEQPPRRAGHENEWPKQVHSHTHTTSARPSAAPVSIQLLTRLH